MNCAKCGKYEKSGKYPNCDSCSVGPVCQVCLEKHLIASPGCQPLPFNLKYETKVIKIVEDSPGNFTAKTEKAERSAEDQYKLQRLSAARRRMCRGVIL